jgi:hypothetical protein
MALDTEATTMITRDLMRESPTDYWWELAEGEEEEGEGYLCQKKMVIHFPELHLATGARVTLTGRREELPEGVEPLIIVDVRDDGADCEGNPNQWWITFFDQNQGRAALSEVEVLPLLHKDVADLLREEYTVFAIVEDAS